MQQDFVCSQGRQRACTVKIGIICGSAPGTTAHFKSIFRQIKHMPERALNTFSKEERMKEKNWPDCHIPNMQKFEIQLKEV